MSTKVRSCIVITYRNSKTANASTFRFRLNNLHREKKAIIYSGKPAHTHTHIYTQTQSLRQWKKICSWILKRRRRGGKKLCPTCETANRSEWNVLFWTPKPRLASSPTYRTQSTFIPQSCIYRTPKPTSRVAFLHKNIAMTERERKKKLPTTAWIKSIITTAHLPFCSSQMVCCLEYFFLFSPFVPGSGWRYWFGGSSRCGVAFCKL